MLNDLERLVELLTPVEKEKVVPKEPEVIVVPPPEQLRERIRELEAENQRLRLALERFVDELQ